MKKTFTYKNDVTLEDFVFLSPTLMLMFTTVLEFADVHNLPVHITSIISDRTRTRAKTKTHQTGRAIDFSCKNWSINDINRLKELLLYKHSEIAAISAKTLKPTPLVFHNYLGQGSHCHLQSRK